MPATPPLARNPAFPTPGDIGRRILTPELLHMTENCTFLTHWGLHRNHSGGNWLASHRPGKVRRHRRRGGEHAVRALADTTQASSAPALLAALARWHRVCRHFMWRYALTLLPCVIRISECQHVCLPWLPYIGCNVSCNHVLCLSRARRTSWCHR